MRAGLLTGAALILAILAGLSLPLFAQDRATLLADTLHITDGDKLVATGNVEVNFQSSRMTATKMTYSQAADQLTISGPIVLDTGSETIILASEADLDADLRNGILKSVRLVLDKQLQITASGLQRIEGRYDAMQNVAASSCQICLGTPAPLWEIRARRMIYDEAEQQIFFDHATFRMAGLPVAYVPRLRLPGPNLKRATGFLVPRLSTNSTIGVGLKWPYFITLGRDKDLTLTPFATNLGSRSLELRYRQAFRTGKIELKGALTQDSATDEDFRGFLQATGQFRLPLGYKLRLRAETVSDAAYFRSYGLDETDRLVTFAEIERISRREAVFGRILGFHTLREGDSNATQPSLIADADWQQRFNLSDWSSADISLHSHARQRGSTNAADGDDADTSADGRDVWGYGLRGNWQSSGVFAGGVIGTVQAGLRADSYGVRQDLQYAGRYTRAMGAFGAQLRLPLVKQTRAARHMIEPIVQIIAAPEATDSLFNEDSALVEFDQGNLFEMNRFSGSEEVEAGTRANLGLNYRRTARTGQVLGLTLGRVLREKDLGQFSTASGLHGDASHWLAAGQIAVPNKLRLSARSILSDAFSPAKTEVRATFLGAKTTLTIGYFAAPADAAEGRSASVQEVTLRSQAKLSSQWKADISGRYDLESRKAVKAGLGLEFRNECLRVDLSLSRSFTSSANVSPSTDFGLSVVLLGFGGSAAGAVGQCQ